MPENQPTPTHSNGVTSKDVPPTEVMPRAKRRSFSAQYKLRILEEADACTEPGEVGALLRREGLYSSNLTRWRRQRQKGQLQGLRSKKRGHKKTPRDEMLQELEQLRREKQQLEARLEQAETIIEVQKTIEARCCYLCDRNSLCRTLCLIRGQRPESFWWHAPVKKHGPWTAGGLEIGDAFGWRRMRSRLGK